MQYINSETANYILFTWYKLRIICVAEYTLKYIKWCVLVKPPGVFMKGWIERQYDILSIFIIEISGLR